MTDEEIFDRLLPHVLEVTGARRDQVMPESNLMSDLGAESLDLLDLSFLIEEEFGIHLEADAIERQAKLRMGDVPYEQDGIVTEAGVSELKSAIPELDLGDTVSSLRKSAIPSLLTVGAFVRLIQLKLAQEQETLLDA